MPYLGKEIEYSSFVVDTFSGDGITTQFSLTVAPGSSSGLLVNISGVLQEPEYAYTVSGTTITFSEAPPIGTNNINIVHLGVRTDIGQPAANSITQNELATSLTNFTHDTFTGTGAQAAFTMSQTVVSDAAVIVFIDGVIQEPTAAYTVSGTSLTFASAPANNTEINVVHLGIVKQIGEPSSGVITQTHLNTSSLKPIVQSVLLEDSNLFSFTGVIAFDDTIPQNTEGDEWNTLSITPKKIGNKLIVKVKIFVSTTVANGLAAALFQDATTDASAVAYQYANADYRTLLIEKEITVTSLSLTTFKVRLGRTSASGNQNVNGYNGSRYFGGTSNSYMSITEVVQ